MSKYEMYLKILPSMAAADGKSFDSDFKRKCANLEPDYSFMTTLFVVNKEDPKEAYSMFFGELINIRFDTNDKNFVTLDQYLSISEPVGKKVTMINDKNNVQFEGILLRKNQNLMLVDYGFFIAPQPVYPNIKEIKIYEDTNYPCDDDYIRERFNDELKACKLDVSYNKGSK